MRKVLLLVVLVLVGCASPSSNVVPEGFVKPSDGIYNTKVHYQDRESMQAYASDPHETVQGITIANWNFKDGKVELTQDVYIREDISYKCWKHVYEHEMKHVKYNHELYEEIRNAEDPKSLFDERSRYTVRSHQRLDSFEEYRHTTYVCGI